MLPFAIFGLAYWLTAGRNPSFEAVLGRGELFIPSSIMNAEAIWTFGYVRLPARAVWYPVIIGTCGLAALGGAICLGLPPPLSQHRTTAWRSRGPPSSNSPRP